MRVVIQRVKQASVTIAGKERAAIGEGLLILLGIEGSDQQEDVQWLCQKISQLRIFPDTQGVMNRSLLETKGEVLLISQFTLHAATKKGNRPSYIKAAKPEIAIPLYEAFIQYLSQVLDKAVKTGEFGAMMDVSLINTGPVTLLIDSRNRE